MRREEKRREEKRREERKKDAEIKGGRQFKKTIFEDSPIALDRDKFLFTL